MTSHFKTHTHFLLFLFKCGISMVYIFFLCSSIWLVVWCSLTYNCVFFLWMWELTLAERYNICWFHTIYFSRFLIHFSSIFVSTSIVSYHVMSCYTTHCRAGFIQSYFFLFDFFFSFLHFWLMLYARLFSANVENNHISNEYTIILCSLTWIKKKRRKKQENIHENSVLRHRQCVMLEHKVVNVWNV